MKTKRWMSRRMPRNPFRLDNRFGFLSCCRTAIPIVNGSNWQRWILAKDTPQAMRSMINCQAGDLVLVDFAFTSSGSGKPRPALVILDSGDADLLLARVTTQSYNTLYDVAITQWKQAGLLAPSVVRLHKLATLAKSRIQKR